MSGRVGTPSPAEGMREVTRGEFWAAPVFQTDIIGRILPGRWPYTHSFETRNGRRVALIVGALEGGLETRRHFLAAGVQ